MFAAFSCSDTPFQSPPGYDGTIENLDKLEPETYFSTWAGDLSLPGSDATDVSADEWSRLLSLQREKGIINMVPEDRKLLLQGAIKAYLIVVQNTERKIATSAGTASVFETYSTEDGLFTDLSTREEESTGVMTQWADAAFARPGRLSTRLFVNSFQTGATAQEWTSIDGGSWLCRLNRDASAGLWLQQQEYYETTAGTVILGSPVRAEIFSGRNAILFEYESRGATVRAWVDENTLVPIGYALPKEARSGAETVSARTVMITGLNLTKTIDRPAGECSSN